MNTLETFLAYADDFEKTLRDDDWSRVERWFSDDAVYRVESELMGCELSGPAAIAAGMKKSLDGFDRRFDGRKIDIDEGPHVEGDELRVVWRVTYHLGDHPPYVLKGRSLARVEDGRVALLVDSYDDEELGAELQAWISKAGVELDPSYV